ncbi:OmpA family protein [Metallibacterium scheffleri]
MKVSRTPWMLSLAILAVIASPFAMADSPGWYIGANVGQSRATIDNQRISNGLLQSGFVTTSMSDRDRNTGFKFFGGYQFNRYFALEGGYFDLGKFGFTSMTLPAGSLNGNIRLRGLDFDVVGFLPITERLSAFGRVGLIYAQARDDFSGTGAVNVRIPYPRKNATNYKFGVGLQYALTQSLGMRLEAERYRIDDAVGNKGDIDLLSVGLIYRFGGEAPPPPPPPEAAPAPPPPPPPPVEAPAPVPAQQKVVIELRGVQFQFDRPRPGQSDVNGILDHPVADSIAILAQAADTLKRYPDVTIQIDGYTDAIGSQAYNLKLSDRRAEFVANYLTAHGVPASQIVGTKGFGKDDPVASNETAEGRTRNRRVEFKVENAAGMDQPQQ